MGQVTPKIKNKIKRYIENENKREQL